MFVLPLVTSHEFMNSFWETTNNNEQIDVKEFEGDLVRIRQVGSETIWNPESEFQRRLTDSVSRKVRI